MACLRSRDGIDDSPSCSEGGQAMCAGTRRNPGRTAHGAAERQVLVEIATAERREPESNRMKVPALPSAETEPTGIGVLPANSIPESVDGLTGGNLYRSIRQAIVSLQFAPGQRMSENELSRLFHASRTPIRDALKRLEREGLVVISPRRRTTVTRLDLATFRQFVVAREALERTAAEMAARKERNRREALISSVTLLAEQIETGDADAFHACDRAFHLQVMQIANLEQVHEIVESLRGLTDRIRFAHMTYLESYDRAEVVRQHARIAEAIAMGDAGAAGAAMQTHVLSVVGRVVQLAGICPDLFSENLSEELEQLQGSLRP